MAMLKIIGIAIFAIVGLWISNFSIENINVGQTTNHSVGGQMAAVALTILAFKGFTTITNSGSELVEPHKNVGRAIMISIAVCTVIYGLVAWAVASNLSINEIIKQKIPV